MNITEEEIKNANELFEIIYNKLEVLINEYVPGYQIVDPKLLPYGLGKAAKGRSVWRIVEEIIAQNLEFYKKELGFEAVERPEEELGVYDCTIDLPNYPTRIFLNIKAARESGRRNKDDVSKAEEIESFYLENPNSILLVAVIKVTFEGTFLNFKNVILFNVAWTPDIYVNPSNNNLQSSKYRNGMIVRTQEEFLGLLREEMETANQKRISKLRLGSRK